MPLITILHTGDMHNRLTEEKAEHLKQLKLANHSSLLLDSGDAIWAGNVFVRPGGEPALKLMNRAGYDAMAMGNREFHFLDIGFRSKIRNADFPVLSANIRAKNGGSLPILPHIVKTVSGLKVAIFGLSVPMIIEKSFAAKASNFFFVKPVEAASQIVPTLKKEADLVFALTHIGLERDIELAEKVAGINLIFGGHTHVKEIVQIGNTAIIHSGWHAKYIGMALFDSEKGLVERKLIDL